jgi:hypothetical protein
MLMKTTETYTARGMFFLEAKELETLELYFVEF